MQNFMIVVKTSKIKIFLLFLSLIFVPDITNQVLASSEHRAIDSIKEVKIY